MTSGSPGKQTKQVELCKWEKKKRLSAADFIWAACRYGGDLDLGGSPQVIKC